MQGGRNKRNFMIKTNARETSKDMKLKLYEKYQLSGREPGLKTPVFVKAMKFLDRKLSP